MHAVIDSKTLGRALKWHFNGSTLRTIRVTVADGILTLESASTEAWRRTRLPVTAAEDGSVIVVWARLADQLRVGRGSDVEISLSGNTVVTKVARSTARSFVVPEMRGFWEPREPLADVAEADLGDLEWAFKAVSATAARAAGEASETLKSVQVEVADSKIVLSSTDSYRLGQVSLECMASQSGTWLVAPAALVGALGVMSDPIRLITAGGHLGFTDGVSETLGVAISGKFPKIGPTLARARSAQSHLVVSTRDLVDALTSSGSGPHSQVVCEVTEDALTVVNRVSSENAPGQTETVLDAVVSGLEEGTKFTLNDSYLAAMLRAVRSAYVVLATTPGGNMLTIREHDSTGDATWLGALALVSA